MAEDNRLAGAPVVVIDLCAVPGRHCAHNYLVFSLRFSCVVLELPQPRAKPQHKHKTDEAELATTWFKDIYNRTSRKNQTRAIRLSPAFVRFFSTMRRVPFWRGRIPRVKKAAACFRQNNCYEDPRLPRESGPTHDPVHDGSKSPPPGRDVPLSRGRWPNAGHGVIDPNNRTELAFDRGQADRLPRGRPIPRQRPPARGLPALSAAHARRRLAPEFPAAKREFSTCSGGNCRRTRAQGGIGRVGYRMAGEFIGSSSFLTITAVSKPERGVFSRGSYRRQTRRQIRRSSYSPAEGGIGTIPF